jgi:hypothetical protein
MKRRVRVRGFQFQRESEVCESENLGFVFLHEMRNEICAFDEKYKMKISFCVCCGCARGTGFLVEGFWWLMTIIPLLTFL